MAHYGEIGLMSRGIENPLLPYAKANNIIAAQLILADGNWSDHEGCIARRNWVPYRTEEYRDIFTTNPFDFIDAVDTPGGASAENELAGTAAGTPCDAPMT